MLQTSNMWTGSASTMPSRAQLEKKTAPSLAVPSAVEDDLDGTSKRKKGEQRPGSKSHTSLIRSKFWSWNLMKLAFFDLLVWLWHENDQFRAMIQSDFLIDLKPPSP